MVMIQCFHDHDNHSDENDNDIKDDDGDDDNVDDDSHNDIMLLMMKMVMMMMMMMMMMIMNNSYYSYRAAPSIDIDLLNEKLAYVNAFAERRQGNHVIAIDYSSSDKGSSDN